MYFKVGEVILIDV